MLREEDQELFARELDRFLPDRVFDAHAHLYERRPPMPAEGMPEQVGRLAYLAMMGELFPGRRLSANFITSPWSSAADPAAADAASAWTCSEAAGDPDSRAAVLVLPRSDPEKVRETVRRLGAKGLKCYHFFAASKPTWEADIPDYLPEPLVRLAHEENLVITLHLVKSRAVADPANIRWIRYYCEKYPRMTMVLAHSARAFQPAHAFEGLPQLTGLENLYFDCSANCATEAHLAVIRIIGHDKLMYGSDFRVSHLRGRPVGAGDSFLWLYEDSPVWREKQALVRPVLVGLENLRSLKWACWAERLTDRRVEDIFWRNAARVFGFA